MSKFSKNFQKVTFVKHWTKSLFSFRITRPKSFKYRSGEFVMIGLPDGNDKPILRERVKIEESSNNDNETVNKIIEVLDTKIRPAVARDGGDIKFKSFKNGVVKVQLQGSCSGCPSSLMTLKQGVQNLLKHYVKEVNSVEAVE